MVRTFKWKSNWLNGSTEIFEDEQLKATLVNKGWRGNSEATFENYSYQFINKGFWKVKTLVYEAKNQELLATITYGGWNCSAIITKPNGAVYTCKAEGFWRRKFIITNEIREIVYLPRGRSGSLSSNADDSLLLLCGIFVMQTYNKMAAAAVA